MVEVWFLIIIPIILMTIVLLSLSVRKKENKRKINDISYFGIYVYTPPKEDSNKPATTVITTPTPVNTQEQHTIKYESEYDRLLHTDQWLAKRQKILDRDKHKCVYCGCEHSLQVHHKYYSKYPNGVKVAPWNYPDDALITLCDSCHKKVHSKKKIKTYFRSYNSRNYSKVGFVK